jgi:hypothetical protein
MIDSTFRRIFFFGSKETKLYEAKKLYDVNGKRFLEDQHFKKNIENLLRLASTLHSHMEGMKMAKLCAGCASEENGGCCSSTMANETDSIQICMNLLAGVNVGIAGPQSTECRYLGKTGCIFVFKPFFCLNYNCQKIKQQGSSEDLKILELYSSQLLGKQYELECSILDLLDSSPR